MVLGFFIEDVLGRGGLLLVLFVIVIILQASSISPSAPTSRPDDVSRERCGSIWRPQQLCQAGWGWSGGLRAGSVFYLCHLAHCCPLLLWMVPHMVFFGMDVFA